MKPLLVLGCIIALLATGCGKKGEPRAPELATPQTIKNLTAKPDPAGVVLTWRRPTEYVDGKPLTDLTGFVIFRKDLSPTCPECPVPYRPLVTVNVEDREKFVKQKQYRFIDENVEPKSIYRYRVSSQLKDGSLSEPSNEVEITRGP
ncbi:MAG: fibronectin type III domain-containing protein [Candidatus Binatia bacterium]